MKNSLAEQLLSKGLIDNKKAKKIKQEERKLHKQKKAGVAVKTDDQKARLEAERAAQVERDKALNQQRLAASTAKAQQAQVLQILQHSQQPTDGDIHFNFVDPRTNKIKQIYVTKTMQDHLAAGKLAICALTDVYFVVPAHVADKVISRTPEALIYLADPTEQQMDEDDPYKDYQIPDDLMW